LLEIKNLKKIYNTKKGAAVHALDGVSLRFPEKGMVFLLGKSGSGKSTLLNVCGGLDSPTEGEIIVKGRSSKSFSGSDFDSYRNTFIGFIFQEYNILNEFSVEDNIALALELQGKPKDKAAIAALLEEVDLTGYAKRKPNTLSGGQKQRIAIARALVKRPEIIMADEPTGALDSNTGKQVFDTLKKLSRDKLVIVVSHDRDFAEQYGDRIIELKDGKVLSDVSKGHAEAEEISQNMNRVGDVLCIKKGAELTDKDFAQIKAFLQKTDNDVVIARDEKSVKTFKTAARITEGGEMEVFKQTDPEQTPKKEYSKEDSKFIRSRLPLRHAFKIGVSGMRNKPVRLFFTVLLCSVAFVLFGLLSTLNFYDSKSTFFQTLRDTDIVALQLIRDYKSNVTWYRNGEAEHSYENIVPAKFSPKDLQDVESSMNKNAFGGVQTYFGFNLQQVKGAYWNSDVTAVAYLPEGNELRGRITGEYPAQKGEMVITSYFADMLIACKTYARDGSVLEFASRDEIIGKKVVLEGKEYKITGIFDSGAIPEEYSVLKESTGNDNYNLYRNYNTYLQSGLHLLCFVDQEEAREMSQRFSYYKEDRSYYMQIATGAKYFGQFDIPDYSDHTYRSVADFTSSRKYYPITSEDRNLKDNEVIVPMDVFSRILNNFYNQLMEELRQQEKYDKSESYYEIIDAAWQLETGGTWLEDVEDKENAFKPFTDEEFAQRMEYLLQCVKRDNVDLTLGVQLFNQSSQSRMGEVREFTVVGVYRRDTEEYNTPCYLTQAVTDQLWEEQKVSVESYPESESKFVEDADAVYSVVILPGNVPEEKMEQFWEIFNNNEFAEDDSRLRLEGGFVSSLKVVDSMVKDLSQIFLYVGLVLAVFAALLLSNFISVSISGKKREIGILRAVGARGTDVFKIFFSESFVIGLVCVAISSVASYFLCQYLNSQFAVDLGASIFVFGVMSMAVLVGIALVTIVVATFLPVYNAARKKPVDSIRAV